MASTTTTLALPYPTLTDPPNVPSDMSALATSIDTLLGAAPLGTGTNSLTLAGTADVRCTQSAETTILSTSITLARSQWVGISGKARLDNSGGADAGVGIHVQVDGTQQPLSHAGPVFVAATTGRNQLSTGMFSVLLSAGSHTIALMANRDANGVIDAVHSGTLSTGPTYHPTALQIIV